MSYYHLNGSSVPYLGWLDMGLSAKLRNVTCLWCGGMWHVTCLSNGPHMGPMWHCGSHVGLMWAGHISLMRTCHMGVTWAWCDMPHGCHMGFTWGSNESCDISHGGHMELKWRNMYHQFSDVYIATIIRLKFLGYLWPVLVDLFHMKCLVRGTFSKTIIVLNFRKYTTI